MTKLDQLRLMREQKNSGSVKRERQYAGGSKTADGASRSDSRGGGVNRRPAGVLGITEAGLAPSVNGPAGVATGPREFRKPLASERDKTLAATEPWKAAGLSRRTWYRRRKAQEGK